LSCSNAEGVAQFNTRGATHAINACLSSWNGRLISETTSFHSHLPQFKDRLPLRIGLVHLDNGPIALAYVEKSVPAAPAEVHLTAQLDETGYATLVAR
jgi:hypothetical protein